MCNENGKISTEVYRCFAILSATRVKNKHPGACIYFGIGRDGWLRGWGLVLSIGYFLIV